MGREAKIAGVTRPAGRWRRNGAQGGGEMRGAVPQRGARGARCAVKTCEEERGEGLR